MGCDDKAICVLGDFNSIMAASEKWGGNEVFSSQNRAFNSWVHENGLLDLGHHGPCYTWMNKKSVRDLIAQRLDRALGNIVWATKNPDIAMFHLPRFSSDHLPIFVRTKPLAIRRKPQFCCENWWSLQEGFKGVCQKSAELGNGDWEEVTRSFRKKVRRWKSGSDNPNVMLGEG